MREVSLEGMVGEDVDDDEEAAAAGSGVGIVRLDLHGLVGDGELELLGQNDHVADQEASDLLSWRHLVH